MTPSVKLSVIDRGMMLVPPHPRGWEPERPDAPRFGWDPRYSSFGQEFSPWFFAKNCAAVLGHTRVHGRNPLMCEMAEYLVSVAGRHIVDQAGCVYVENAFPFSFLWQQFVPPFYGAFMNNVTAYGLLHLYEAIGREEHRNLAHALLVTSADRSAPIPLFAGGDGDSWLREYVFRVPPDAKDAALSVGLREAGGWFGARIFNGHVHALLALLRHREMFGVDGALEGCIDDAVGTMCHWLPQQVHQGRYFSYCADFLVYPDYGQARACHLCESLSELSGLPDLRRTAFEMRRVFEDVIRQDEKSILESARREARRAYKVAVGRSNRPRG